MPKPVPVRLGRYRLLLSCLAISLVLHFGVIPLLVALFGVRAVPQTKMDVYQVRSSALTIAREPKPRPARVPQPPQPVEPRPPAQQRPQRRTIRPARVPREIARFAPHAPAPAPRPAPQQIDTAQQEAQFEATIAHLRQADNPLASAARPVATPAAPKRYTFDFRGSVGTAPQAEGILTPVKSWKQAPYTYYYVSYWVQYADGSIETGYVPWPIRYLPANDPFLHHWEHFPLPTPLPDFTLPAGTAVHPLIAFCLRHRDEFSDCPIAHG